MAQEQVKRLDAEARRQELNKMFQRVKEKGVEVEVPQVRAPKAEQPPLLSVVEERKRELEDFSEKARSQLNSRIESLKAIAEEFRNNCRRELEKASAVSSEKEMEYNEKRRGVDEKYAKREQELKSKWETEFQNLRASQEKEIEAFWKEAENKVNRLFNQQARKFDVFVNSAEKLLLKSQKDVKEIINEYEEMEKGFTKEQNDLIKEINNKADELLNNNEISRLRALGEFTVESIRIISDHVVELRRLGLESEGAGGEEMERFTLLAERCNDNLDKCAYIARNAGSKEEALRAEQYAKQLLQIIATRELAREQISKLNELDEELSSLWNFVHNREGAAVREAEKEQQINALLLRMEEDLQKLAKEASENGKTPPDLETFKLHARDIAAKLVEYDEPEKVWKAILKMANKVVLEKGSVDYNEFFSESILLEKILGTDIRFIANNELFAVAKEESPEFCIKKLEAAFPKLKTNLVEYILEKYPSVLESAGGKELDVEIKDLKALGGGRGRIGAMITTVEVTLGGNLIVKEDVILKGLVDELEVGIGLKKTKAGNVEKTALEMLTVIYPERYAQYLIMPCEEYMVMTIVKDENGQPAKTYEDILVNKDERKKLTIEDIIRDGRGIGEAIALSIIGIGDRHAANAMPIGKDRTRIEIDFGESFKKGCSDDSIAKLHDLWGMYVEQLNEIAEREGLKDAVDIFKESVEAGFKDAFERIRNNKDKVLTILESARDKVLIDENNEKIRGDDLDEYIQRVKKINRWEEWLPLTNVDNFGDFTAWH